MLVVQAVCCTEKCHMGLLFEFTQRNLTYSRTTHSVNPTNISLFNIRIRWCTFVVRRIKYQFQIAAFDLMCSIGRRIEYQWTIKLYEFKSFVQQFKERRIEIKRKNKINICPFRLCFWLISLNNNTFRLFCMHKLQPTAPKMVRTIGYYTHMHTDCSISCKRTKFRSHFENVSTNAAVAPRTALMTWRQKTTNYENATNIYVTHFKTLYHKP